MGWVLGELSGCLSSTVCSFSDGQSRGMYNLWTDQIMDWLPVANISQVIASMYHSHYMQRINDVTQNKCNNG